jgi:flagellin
MRINNNLMAMNTHRAMGSVQGAQSKSMEKLSSGYRINRAGDDAAGLAISEKMRGQIRGLNQASRNSQDGISMIQTAEGALNETQAILQRMRELAVQSANDTNVDADRTSIQNEIDQLSTEITRIADTTEFNTQKLLNGGLDDVKFQIGANEGQDMKLSIGDMRAASLNVVSTSTEIVSAGGSITGVDADADFNVEGITLTAVEGGAIGAVNTGVAATVAAYADNVTVSKSEGVTNSGDWNFNNAGITLSVSDDVDWSSINTSGAATRSGLTISVSGDYITVDIDVMHGSGSGAAFTAADAITANADGDYVYDAHGVSFTVSAEEFATFTTGQSTFDVDLAVHKASGDDVDFTGTIQGNGNLTTTTSGTGTDVVFSGGAGTEIALNAASADWLSGVDRIVVSGAGLETSGGAISVTLYDGAQKLSEDVFIASSGDAFTSGVGATNTFTYDNHGVSFAIKMGSASTDFKLDDTIETIDKSVTGAAGNDLVFDVTASDGSTKTVTVDLDDGEAISLSGAVNEINIASSGAGAGAVATLDGDKIVLSAADTGSGSTVDITTVGLATLGLSVSTKTGSAASIDFTLKNAAGATIDSGSVATNAGEVTFQDAAGTDANEITFDLKSYNDLAGLNVAKEFAVQEIEKTEAGINVSTQSSASAAITTINNAIESVSKERSKLGAVQNRLEHTIANLDTSAENLQASESRIRDVDMAKEMMEFTKNNILQQAAQSMLAQANQAPQGVLQLLR